MRFRRSGALWLPDRGPRVRRRRFVLAVGDPVTGYLMPGAAGAYSLTGSPADLRQSAGEGPPADPGSGYLFADDMDGYTSGVPDTAASPYGNFYAGLRSCVADGATSGASMITGRGGSGLAFRWSISSVRRYLLQCPWGDGYLGDYSSTPVFIMRYWFRISAGGTPGAAGCKGLELWHATSHRGQFGLFSGSDSNPLLSWSHSNPGGVNRTTSPVTDKSWDDVNDGAWHEWIVAHRPNTTRSYSYVSGSTSDTEVYTGSSSRDGFVKCWWDDVLVLNYAQDAVDVAPPGYAGVWCRQGDVDHIPTDYVLYCTFPDYHNGPPGPYTWDIDDVRQYAVASL